MTRQTNSASVAIFNGEKVMLVKRALPPYAMYWTLPGGGQDAGETVEACAIREVEEELGIKLSGLVPVTQSPGGGPYYLEVFAASIEDCTPIPSPEIADWQWVEPEAIAHLRTTPGLEEILILARQKLSQS
jgi:8-oxo-dGTP diphosphatase